MRKWRNLLAAVAMAAIYVIPAVPVHAQSGQGLEISPPLVEVNTDPGKKVTFQVRIRNITSGTLIVKSSIDDFVADGEEGQAKLLLDNNAEPSPYSFKTWAAPIADLRLASQEAKTATVTLTVPQDASPGGHYGVVRFSAVPPELEGSGVALSASIGSLVLVRVSGDITYKASLSEFYTQQNGKRGGIFQGSPVGFVLRLKNEGTVHFKPTGTIRVSGGLKSHEIGVLSINSTGGNVLPNSIRRFEQDLGKKRLFGRYTAELNVEYEGQNLNRTITFWVIPYRLIAISLIILIALFFFLRRGLKGYNRRIIRKASPTTKKK